MSTTILLIALVGALVGGAVVLLIAAIRGFEEKPPEAESNARSLVELIGRQTLFGIGAGVVVLVITRWPVAAIGAGILVAFWPALFGGAKAEREAIARVEGLASWVESLRDTIAGAVGLEQAIPSTVYAASPSIQPQLRMLSDRLRIRVPMPEALQRFADDIDDSSADLIVSALIMNSRLRGPGLRQVLDSLAESARADLDMRQRVYASRASTRRSVQLVVTISLAFMIGLRVINPSYVEPFSTPLGQVVLTVIMALFGAGFLWMRRLAAFETPSRFLISQQRTPSEASSGQKGAS